MNVTEIRAEERLDFLCIDAETRQALDEFRPVLKANLATILDEFYDHIATQPKLSALVGNTANLSRLKQAQSAHWTALFEGVFDDAYVERITRIGHAHARIGLEPRWYMAGYCFALNRIAATAVEAFHDSPEKLSSVIAAINKVVFLDMDLAISVYQDALRDTHSRKLAELAEELEKNVMSVVDGATTSAASLTDSAQGLAKTAEQAGRQAGAVTAASEEASTNVQTVASAAEELSSSIDEISRQVSDSTRISQEAVSEAERADGTVAGLAKAATKIGEVVELINDIAGQTNLLALNATIEAARAGDAGRGFAVVANEVKSLANQTAKATEDIGNQIGAIQGATKDAVGAIQGIGKTISQINEIATAIASAVEEQGAATSEIARNIQGAAEGTAEVSSNIVGVTQAATETDQAAGHVLEAANEVSGHAETLKKEIEKFVGAIRAA